MSDDLAKMTKLQIVEYSLNGIRVYIVDGEVIRDNEYIDFTEGGSWLRYPEFIPEWELWLGGISIFEHQFVLVHELSEVVYTLEHNLDIANNDDDYSEAHEYANTQEQLARDNPDDASKMIADLLGQFPDVYLESDLAKKPTEDTMTKSMPEIKYKLFRPVVTKADDNTGTIDMLIPMSTDSEDRVGEVIEASAWKQYLPQFLKRPILVSSHDYSDLRKQIGEFDSLTVTSNGLLAKPKYYINQGNPEADWAYNLASKGMAAYSVGFKVHDYKVGTTKDDPSVTYTNCELLEISHVIVPANQDAIQGMRGKSAVMDKILDDVELMIDKGVIPYHKYPLAAEDTTWDAGAETGKAEVSDLKKMCAYSDGDGTNKGDYHLPHHKCDGKYTTVWAGVAAAAAAVQGARGASIPDSVKSGVQAHLAQHYKDFDKGKPPWEKSMKQSELMDQLDYTLSGIKSVGISKEARDKAIELAAEIERITGSDISVEYKLCAKHKFAIKAALEGCQKALDTMDEHDKAHKSAHKSFQDFQAACLKALQSCVDGTDQDTDQPESDDGEEKALSFEEYLKKEKVR